MKYYSLTEIHKRAAKYYVIFGERSNGKSYAVLDHALETYFKTGKTAAYIRRWDEDFTGPNSARTCYNSLMHNGKGQNRVRELSGGQYNAIEYYSGNYYLANDPGDGSKAQRGPIICHAFSLNSSEHYKSGSWPDVGIIIFDEFIATKVYLVNEFVVFQNLLMTIIRDRDDITIYMLGNTINRYNPYFQEMGLYKAKDMADGQIDVYEYGAAGLRVAVQRTTAVGSKHKKSNIYFAFDNPHLKMITEGAWQLDIYPHCPTKILPKDIAFIFFIIFDGETVQCEIISTPDGPYIYCHRKTSELKDPDHDLIFTTEYDHRTNWRRRLTRPILPIEKRIATLFAADKVFYQDNSVGDLVSNYLAWSRKAI